MSRPDSTAILERLRAFTERGPHGATLRLSTVTAFTWDRVYAFPPSAPLDVIERSIGRRFELDDPVRARRSADAALLVFTRAGAVVHQMAVGPPLFLVGARGEGYGPREAVLVVHTRDPGPYSALRFRDPRRSRGAE